MFTTPRLTLLVVLYIDNCFRPLASWDMTIEQDINLAVGSIFHLRQEEVCHDQAKKAGATPNVAALPEKCSALHYISNCYRKTQREKSPTVGLSIQLARKMQGNSTM